MPVDHVDLLPLLEDPDKELRDDLHRLNVEWSEAIEVIDRQHRQELVSALRRAHARMVDARATSSPRLTRPAVANGAG